MKKYAMIALAVLGVASASGTAFAVANQHVLSGVSCLGENLVNGFGALNTSASAEFMECPIVDDTIQGDTDVSVLVFDRNRNTNVNCTIFGFDFQGNIIFQQPSNSSGATGPVQTLGASGTIGLSNVEAECNVPPVDSGGPAGGVSGIHMTRSHHSS